MPADHKTRTRPSGTCQRARVCDRTPCCFREEGHAGRDIPRFVRDDPRHHEDLVSQRGQRGRQVAVEERDAAVAAVGIRGEQDNLHEDVGQAART